MIDFNLEYYRAFYYVAQLKSITKAADALFLSQPAVTRSVKQLEERLRCRLFLRTSRGMQLTHEGDVLFTHVSRAFDELIAGEKELVLASSYAAGILEIGATETALHHFLLPKIEQFRNDHPKVYIHVTGSSTPETLHMLREGKADLAVAVSPVTEANDLTVIEISEFQDIFVAGSKFGDLKKRVLTTREICEYPIATVEKGTSARSHIERWFEEQGILFNPEYSVRTSSAVLPFAERNLAVGIVPAMFAQDLIQLGKVFEVRLTSQIAPRRILVMYKDDSHMSALCREFIRYLSAKEAERST